MKYRPRNHLIAPQDIQEYRNSSNKPQAFHTHQPVMHPPKKIKIAHSDAPNILVQPQKSPNDITFGDNEPSEIPNIRQ